MKLAIVDGRITSEIENELIVCGYKVLKTIKHVELQEPIAYHPDMQMCRIDESTVVVCPQMYEYYKEKLKDFEIQVLRGSTVLEAKYPNDIAYNIAIIGKQAFHKSKYTDSIVIDELEKRNITLNSVNQGYSKCSILIGPNDYCITSDAGLFKKLKENNIDVLDMNIKNIDLEGYDCGFIGGCSSIGGSELYITGRLESHDGGFDIKNKLESNGIVIVELSKENLVDYGTIIIMGEKYESNSFKR